MAVASPFFIESRIITELHLHEYRLCCRPIRDTGRKPRIEINSEPSNISGLKWAPSRRTILPFCVPRRLHSAGACLPSDCYCSPGLSCSMCWQAQWRLGTVSMNVEFGTAHIDRMTPAAAPTPGGPVRLCVRYGTTSFWYRCFPEVATKWAPTTTTATMGLVPLVT